METNLIVKTTFKNNLFLMKPFYNFHKDVWRPRRFVFIIGYTGTEKEEIMKIEEIMTGCKLERGEKIGTLDSLAKKIVLYKSGNLYFILYKTEKNYDKQDTWDRLKVKIFRFINKFIDDGSFKRQLVVDNDDFHYVKDPQKAIDQDVLYFHSMEFVPGLRNPSKNSDFIFVGLRYFFRHKGVGKKVFNSCDKCSVVFWDPFNNVCHNSKYDEYRYDKCKKKLELYSNGLNERRLEDLDGFCFSFSCPSLEYLINQKHWVSSIAKPPMRHSLDKKEIIDQFNKNYTLTEEEKSRLICFKIDEFKSIFG